MMCWRALAALLLLALANAGLSVQEAEESTASHVEAPKGQDNSTVQAATRRQIGAILENRGDVYVDQVNINGAILKITGGEVRNINASISNIAIHTLGKINNTSLRENNSVYQLNFGSVTGHNARDGELFYNTSDGQRIVFSGEGIEDRSNNSEGLINDDQYNVTYDKMANGDNSDQLNSSIKIQKVTGSADEKFKISAIEDRTIISVRKENQASTTLAENRSSVAIEAIEVSSAKINASAIENKNVTIVSLLESLLNNLPQTTGIHSPPLSLDAIKTLGAALQNQNITHHDQTPMNEDITSNSAFSLGMFPSPPSNPGHGVFLGTKWKRWDVGVSRGGQIAVDEPREISATLGQIVGVVVDGITFRRSALLASHWNTIKIDTILYKAHYFEHRRTVDALLYDVEGDEEGVQVFWEPFSATWTRVRCDAWVAGQGWDAGRCKSAIFDAGLVGCRCRGATFVEGALRLASFAIVEESETNETLADAKQFERASSYLHEHDVNDHGLKDISKVAKKLLSLQPDMFYNPDGETVGVLLDVGSELHRMNSISNESVVMDVGAAASLVVAESDVGAPLAGLYVGKRWPTDNPEDASFRAVGLRPGGSLLEETSDTEVFAVRIKGNGSLPHRASMLLTNWKKQIILRRYFFKVVFFTYRVADITFSADVDDVDGDGVDVVFETASKDRTTIRCLAWDFHESVWDDNACSSQNISTRLYSCNCTRALFKTNNHLRTRILITEESINHQSFANWDLLNRTSYHFAHLAKLSLPGEHLKNITNLLDINILGKVRSNDYVIPSRVFDNITSILHRLALDPYNSTAFSWHNSSKSTAAIFVQDTFNESLSAVAVTDKHGHIFNSGDSDFNATIVAVSFNPPKNDVGRVALTYTASTSRILVEDRVIHRDRRIVDVSLHQTTPHSVEQEVVLRLKPFVETKQPVTVRSKTCLYWDFDRQDWSEGCFIRLENGKELCQCTIPINNDSSIVQVRFHIASDWSEQVVIHTSVPFFLLLTSELTPQMLIFHTGCALSLFGLITVFVTALAFKSWRQHLANKILLHICSALLLQILSVLFYFVVYHPLFFAFFDFVPHHREWTYLCLAMGVVWSYSYLARWCWMLVMSLLQLMRIVTVMGARNVPYLVRKVSIFAWGGPFIVLGYFLSDPWAYFDELNRRFYFLTYLLPLFVVLVANLAVFAAILARAFACCGWGKMADLERHGANSWLSIWKRLRTVIVLFFTLEMTWLFELFIYFGYYNAFLHVMSFVVTSFHGFGTFVVFVALDRDAQAGWRAALRSGRSRRKMALLYCAVLAIIAGALVVVVAAAVLLVCLHTIA